MQLGTDSPDACITDAGYRSHNAPSDHKFKVYTRPEAPPLGVPPLSLSQATSPDGPQLPGPRQRRRHQRVLAAVGYNLSEGSLDVQAIFRRRRHQPKRPPLAKIRPGRPAPAMGPGTFMAPSNPCISPSIPSVKKRVSGLPLLPPVPNSRAQRPPGIWLPTLIGIVPTK